MQKTVLSFVLFAVACGSPFIASDSTSVSLSAPSVCSSAGFCWVDPVPAGTDTRGIRRMPDGSFFAFGAAGTMMRSTDGISFTGVSGVGSIHVLDAWFDAASKTGWAVGTAGHMWRFASGRWSEEPSPTRRTLTAMFGLGANDVWAVGEGVVLHFDGTAWSDKTADLGAEAAALTGVWARATNDVWICGKGWIGDFGASGDGVAYHYDGRAWHYVDKRWHEGRQHWFTGVWGGPRDEVFFASRGQGIEHYDAAQNDIVAVSGIDAYTLSSMSGSGPDDIWAVGDGEVWHFDGSTWTPKLLTNGGRTLTAPGLDLGSSEPHVSVLARGDVWITGGPTMTRGDGARWAPLTSSSKRERVMPIGGGHDFVWFGGAHAMAHFDGTRLTYERTSEEWDRGTVASFASADAVVRVDAGPPGTPFAVWQRRAGASAWSKIGDIGTGYDAVPAVWLSAHDDVYVSLFNTTGFPRPHTLQHWDGRLWSAVALPPTAPCHTESVGTGGSTRTTCPAGVVANIGGTGRSNVWLLEDDQHVVRFDGARWTDDRLALSTDAIDAHCTDGFASMAMYVDRNDHGFIGCAGGVLEITGTSARFHDFPGHQTIYAISGTGPNEVFAVGGSQWQGVSAAGVLAVDEPAYGAMYRFDGRAFSEVASGAAWSLRSVWGDAASGDVWTASGEGILRRVR